MAGGGHDEGKGHRRSRLPRRGFPLPIVAITLVAAIVTAAGALSAQGEPVRHAAQGIVAGVTQTPRSTPTTALTPAAGEPPVITRPPAVTATLAPTTVATDTATPTSTPVATSVSNTPTIDGAWSATPIATTPGPTTALAQEAETLRLSIQTRFGVRILVDGQVWGGDAADQVRHLGAVERALASVPASVLEPVLANAGGPLTFASNGGGRTEAGWQPYGDRAANFYSNEDRGLQGRTAANQIVLQPGSGSQTIAHEIMHAYQVRDQAPGDYVSALLTPEMKSYMTATGWRQLVSDDEIRNAGGSWSTVNPMFLYEGRSTSYVNEYGTLVGLYAPNPLESFAEAGGLYYARSEATTLPDWPEYWLWFAANVD